jgi:hypothetical protein
VGPVVVCPQRGPPLYLSQFKGRYFQYYINLFKILHSIKASSPDKIISLQGCKVGEKKMPGAENCFQINSQSGETLIFRTGMRERYKEERGRGRGRGSGRGRGRGGGVGGEGGREG